MNGWTRVEKLALFTLVIGLFAALAAWLMVPEFRGTIGLKDLHANSSNESIKPAYVYSSEDTLKYTDNGVSFAYPRSTKLSTQNVNRNDGSVVIIQLGAHDGVLAQIQIWSVSSPPEDVRNKLINGILNDSKTKNADILTGTGKTVKRRILGVHQEGEIVEDLYDGIHIMTEVYAFRKDTKVIAVVLIHNIGASDIASEFFATITDSLQ
jgi:hypothetical protein